MKKVKKKKGDEIIRNFLFFIFFLYFLSLLPKQPNSSEKEISSR